MDSAIHSKGLSGLPLSSVSQRREREGEPFLCPVATMLSKSLDSYSYCPTSTTTPTTATTSSASTTTPSATFACASPTSASADPGTTAHHGTTTGPGTAHSCTSADTPTTCTSADTSTTCTSADTSTTCTTTTTSSFTVCTRPPSTTSTSSLRGWTTIKTGQDKLLRYSNAQTEHLHIWWCRRTESLLLY